MPEMSPAAASPEGQAPFGVSSATGPTPNAGYEAAGLQKLGMAVKQLTELLPLLGATSESGQAVLDALKKLAKFVPAGAVSPAGESNQIAQMMQRNVQNQQMQAMRQMPPGGGTGGAPPSPQQQRAA